MILTVFVVLVGPRSVLCLRQASLPAHFGKRVASSCFAAKPEPPSGRLMLVHANILIQQAKCWRQSTWPWEPRAGANHCPL